MELVKDVISYRKYEAYRDSGVEWIGEVPVHWDVRPGFTVVEERTEKNIGMTEKTVLSLSYGNLIIKPEEKLTGLVPESFETYQLVYPGDIIIRPTDLQNDKTSLRTGLAKNRGIITSAYINLKVKDAYSKSYYHYFLHTVDITKVIYGLGTGLRQNLDYGEFKRFKFLVPPINEQTAIANFLDQKTALIDKAIAIKEKQIELLKERQQILIQKAVTRGLNPNVKMKDSGVESIGKIPEHWEVARVKQFSNKISKGTTPSTEGRAILDEGPIKYIKAENIQDGFITDHPAHFIDEKTNDLIRRSQLQENDVLFVIAGATLGKVAIIKGEHVPSNTNQAVAFIRPSSKVVPQYLSIWLTSFIIRELIWLNAVQSAQPNLSMEDLGNFPIILPGIEEQKLILNHIEMDIAKIVTAISIKEIEIGRLSEFKTTLINSAVTGKVKICQNAKCH